MGESVGCLGGLAKFQLVFWDFDGVVKDSVAVKTDAFVQLFQPFGGDIASRVRIHHEKNGGMSRLEKMPRYLEWSGEDVTPQNIEAYCQRFSDIVLSRVIDAPWVPGVERVLRGNPYQQEFILVTATPQEEIEEILAAINLRSSFAEVFGAPTRKVDAIKTSLASRSIDPSTCLMIGDAKADMDAALANNVPFLLRLHASNRDIFKGYTGDSVEDFLSL